MQDEEELRLFLYNCAVVQRDLATVRRTNVEPNAPLVPDARDDELTDYVAQFSEENRRNARQMASWYVLFYMLENDIRQFVRETLQTKAPLAWWDSCVPEPVQKEVELNRQRELDLAFQPRSDDPLDYTTFGQLGDIIRTNWDVFGGVLSSQKAMGRVMATLNGLRGPVAHCGVLAPDEVDRLKLSVKDWFRVLGGAQ